MKMKALMLSLLAILLATPAMAQNKIGYTNFELILGLMPEAKQVEQELTTLQTKLSEQLEIKQRYLQNKFQEYQANAQAGSYTDAQIQEKQQELQRLDQEVQDFAAESDRRLQTKRDELLSPLVQRVQEAIVAIAERDGYDYILDIGGRTGVTNILHGPEEHDVTERVLEHLGVELPEEGAEATDGTNNTPDGN